MASETRYIDPMLRILMEKETHHREQMRKYEQARYALLQLDSDGVFDDLDSAGPRSEPREVNDGE